MTILITTGEPAGIGPDICLTLLAMGGLASDMPVCLLIDPVLLSQRQAQLKLTISIPLLPWQDGPLLPSSQAVYIYPIYTKEPVEAGKLNVANAGYVIEMLTTAAQWVMSGKASAIVTAPVHKGVINDAGVSFSGHTEFLMEQAGVPEVVMMLATQDLRVALVTTHLPLSDVPNAITQEKLTRVLSILLQDLHTKFAIAQPVIKVCGLNPHAGEEGYLGREEIDVINPVCRRFQDQGYSVSLALAADTLFTPKSLMGVDAVLSMFHDQGLPVLKAKGFGAAVNITLGLPFIRTSVDHGTALTLAGTKDADHSSLQLALSYAINMVKSTNHSLMSNQ